MQVISESQHILNIIKIVKRERANLEFWREAERKGLAMPLILPHGVTCDESRNGTNYCANMAEAHLQELAYFKEMLKNARARLKGGAQ
jgi:hypothetical protein